MFGKKIDLEEKNRYSEALKQKRFDLRNNTKKSLLLALTSKW